MDKSHYGNYNLYESGTDAEIVWVYLVNTMAADALAPSITRALAAVVLTIYRIN